MKKGLLIIAALIAMALTGCGVEKTANAVEMETETETEEELSYYGPVLVLEDTHSVDPDTWEENGIRLTAGMHADAYQEGTSLYVPDWDCYLTFNQVARYSSAVTTTAVNVRVLAASFSDRICVAEEGTDVFVDQTYSETSEPLNGYIHCYLFNDNQLVDGYICTDYLADKN